MKETVLFLVICLLIVGALGLLGSHYIGVSILAPKLAVPFEYGDVKADKPAPAAAKPKRISTIVKPSTPVQPAKQESPRAHEPEPAVPAAIPTLPFPLSDDIRVGLADSSIKERFGSPTLTATTLDSGHRFEAFVYTQNRTETVIHLQDGKVTSAYSIPNLLASRLFRNNP